MRNIKETRFVGAKHVFVVFLFFIGILYLRLLYLALSPKIDGINMQEFALNRNTSSRKLYATRGTIYDSNGSVLASNVSSYTVIAYLEESRTTSESRPEHVVDINLTAELLSPVLDMPKERLVSLLSLDLYQVELGPGGRNISESKKQEIEDLNLPGISFLSSQSRHYPNGDFASYVIGYAKKHEVNQIIDEVSTTTFSLVGELGIESKYDDELKGSDGSLIYQRDRFGYKIPDTKETRIEPVNGKDIYLTIDAAIQRFLETEVKEINVNNEPDWVQISVMNAKTGAILGTATTPSYNPNTLNITNYENPLISYVFEPGSTMKTFTYLCALESGNYDGDTLYESGSTVVSNRTINDWNKKGWGEINYDTGYIYSSNTAISDILHNVLKKEQLRECLLKYGFSKKTGIELSREQPGKVNFNYDIEVVSAGFGQGITTTAIQHLQALTLISSGGNMIKPYIVEKILNPDNNKIEYTHKLEITENVVSKENALYMRDLMNEVVNGEDPQVTGKPYRVDSTSLIGKTGTAQIYEDGRYLSGYNDYIYSFSGMFPYDDPEIIVYAAIKKPNNYSASLARSVRNIVNNITKYLNIDEDLNVSVDAMIVPQYISRSLDEIESDDLYIILGDGNNIINQYPKDGVSLINNEKIILLTDYEEKTMPDLTGLSHRDILKISEMLDLDLEINGFGYVVNYELEENRLLVELER